MALDLHIKRIRRTPYKLVFSKDEVIGIFDHNKYVSKANMNDAHKDIMTQNRIDIFEKEVTSDDSIVEDSVKC